MVWTMTLEVAAEADWRMLVEMVVSVDVLVAKPKHIPAM